jgi:hypothetical protein
MRANLFWKKVVAQGPSIKIAIGFVLNIGFVLPKTARGWKARN